MYPCITIYRTTFYTIGSRTYRIYRRYRIHRTNRTNRTHGQNRTHRRYRIYRRYRTHGQNRIYRRYRTNRTNGTNGTYRTNRTNGTYRTNRTNRSNRSSGSKCLDTFANSNDTVTYNCWHVYSNRVWNTSMGSFSNKLITRISTGICKFFYSFTQYYKLIFRISDSHNYVCY
jgi:hypothetical protein